MGRGVAGDRVRPLFGVPLRAVRPREHGAGGLEHRSWSPARGDAGRRRASSWCASAPTSTRSWRCSRRSGSSFRLRSCSSPCRSLAVALGALPVYWLARRHARIGAGRRAARAHVSRVSVDRVERARRLPSRHAGDSAAPLLRLVPRHRPPAAVRGVCGPRRGRPASSWRCRSPRSASGTRWRVGIGARAPSSPLGGLAWTVVAALPSSFRRSRARRASSTGTTRRSAAHRRASSSTAVTDPLDDPLGYRARQRRALPPAPVVPARRPLRSLARGSRSSHSPQLAANLLAGREHVTDPHVHYVAGIVPFLFAAAAIGLGRLSAPGRVRAVTVALTLSLCDEHCDRALAADGPRRGRLGHSRHARHDLGARWRARACRRARSGRRSL